MTDENHQSLTDIERGVPFAARHIGPDSPAVRRMREVVLGAAPARPGRAGGTRRDQAEPG